MTRDNYWSVMGSCLIAAVLLTLVLWLVPLLPGWGVSRQDNQAHVAFAFLSAAGLLIILTTKKTLRLRRQLKGSRATFMAIGSLGLLTLLLLVFMGLTIKLLSTPAFYGHQVQTPVESAFMFLGAAALSLVLLVKIVLKVRQQRVNDIDA